MTDAKTILTNARDILKTNGITNGTLVRDTEGGRCYCSLGAIALASGFIVETVEDEVDWQTGEAALHFAGIDHNYEVLNKTDAVQALARTIDPDATSCDSGYAMTVANFSDCKKLRGESPTIIAMFDKAIASL